VTPASDSSTIWSEAAGDPSAPLVVLVHGSMDRSAGLLRLSRRLDVSCRVVRYDRRGYGRSLGVGPPFAISDQVDDLAGVMERHATGRRAAIVFGHSFGGNVALALAQRHPELVGAVAVFETPLAWLDWWPGNTAGATALTVHDPGDAAEAFMRRLVGDEVWDRLPPSKRAARRAEGPAMTAELADIRRRPPWSADALLLPVLALHGEHARAHHRRAMEELSAMLPDCRTEVVAGAGHAAPHTDPDAVAERLFSLVGG
jgi:pimeloyl-ACP methyl ester carboxylesterase